MGEDASGESFQFEILTYLYDSFSKLLANFDQRVEEFLEEGDSLLDQPSFLFV